MTKSMRPPVIIRDIVETGHPAKGQRGLFTCKKIAPRTHILDYVGEVHCDDRPESDYDLSLYHAPGGVNVGVDASKMGNAARFTNDYRGVRQKPNALFEERRTPSGELCMSIWSGSESIRKGEEILVSYGKGFWRARSSTAEGADSMEQPGTLINTSSPCSSPSSRRCVLSRLDISVDSAICLSIPTTPTCILQSIQDGPPRALPVPLTGNVLFDERFLR